MSQIDYSSMHADQITADYMHRLRLAKAVLLSYMILAILLILWIGFLDLPFPLTILLLLLVIASGKVASLLFRRRISVYFNALTAILTESCDPDKYLAVMQYLEQKDKRKRSRSTLLLEQALAHYYNAQIDEALSCLAEVKFRNPFHLSYVRKSNVYFNICQYQGNKDGCEQALERLRGINKKMKKGSRNYQIICNIIRMLLFYQKPVEELDKEDRIYIMQQISGAENRLNRISWQLRAAEYEAVHGSHEEAERFLKLVSSGPYPKVFEKRMAGVKEKL